MQSDRDFESCASRLKALADPGRLQIVDRLLDGEQSVSSLAGELGVAVDKVSHHLGVLRAAQLVQTRREGKYVVYSVPAKVARAGRGLRGEKTLDLGCCQINLGEPAEARGAARFDDLARQFASEGYAIVRGMFSAQQIDAVDAELKSLLARGDLIQPGNLRCRWQDDTATGACVFDAFDPVIDLGPACARVAGDATLLALLQALCGEPVCLFKDRVIFKPPGATGYALHQDYIAWPGFPESLVTLVVAVDPADEESGCIEVFPGYHNRGCLTPSDGNYHEIPPDAVEGTTSVKLELAPGDVAAFSGFMPHRSAPNRSRHWRRLLYFSYNARSDGGDCRQTHYEQFRVWLRERYAEYGRSEAYFA
ncbi:MAG: ArsR family transcriptional regulator [Planctomycetota bacterium]|nr:MAG: ArsR family transcriptional regulator [Planctomycetota bacterium]